jgi:hypothetical protein
VQLANAELEDIKYELANIATKNQDLEEEALVAFTVAFLKEQQQQQQQLPPHQLAAPKLDLHEEKFHSIPCR